jgi:hypothetical protein
MCRNAWSFSRMPSGAPQTSTTLRSAVLSFFRWPAPRSTLVRTPGIGRGGLRLRIVRSSWMIACRSGVRNPRPICARRELDAPARARRSKEICCARVSAPTCACGFRPGAGATSGFSKETSTRRVRSHRSPRCPGRARLVHPAPEGSSSTASASIGGRSREIAQSNSSSHCPPMV